MRIIINRTGESMKKRYVQTLITVLVMSSLVVMPVMAEPNDEVQALEIQKSELEDQAGDIQSQLVSLLVNFNALQQDIENQSQRIVQAETDLQEAEAKEKAQYEDMKLRIQYIYEESDDSLLEALITSRSFSELVNKAEYIQNVHSYDRKQLQEYVETKQQISDLKDSLEKDQKELESKQAEYEKQGDNLNNLITSKSAEVANLDSEIQAAAEAAAREAAERAAREAAAKEAERQQAAASNHNAASTSNRNNTTSNRNNTTSSSTATSNRNNTTSSSSASVATKPSNSSSSTTTSGTNANGGSIVSRAYSQLGKPYVWGACGPNSFDCSGFVSYCLTGSYTRLGTTLTFMGWTRVSNPQPGDVVTTATHCGIYIGNGQMIHAPHTGDVVKVGPVQSGMIYVRR